MTKHFKTALCAAVLVGATALVTTQVVSQTPGQEMPDPAAMMEEFMKLAAPGKHHRMLQKQAGLWTSTTRHWMYPGGEPEVATVMTRYRPVLGGRFLMQESFGEMSMMGEPMPFEGLGLYGYDNYKKKHLFAWADNFGTMMMLAEGTADESGKVITYFSEMPDPMSGQNLRVKSVTRMISDDEMVYRMYIRQPDDSWFKTFEVSSERAD